MIVVERGCERGEERGDDNGMKRERILVREERPVKMEEGSEKRLLELRSGRENEMEKRKREETKRVEREDRPLNISDGREVREL